VNSQEFTGIDDVKQKQLTLKLKEIKKPGTLEK